MNIKLLLRTRAQCARLGSLGELRREVLSIKRKGFRFLSFERQRRGQDHIDEIAGVKLGPDSIEVYSYTSHELTQPQMRRIKKALKLERIKTTVRP